MLVKCIFKNMVLIKVKAIYCNLITVTVMLLKALLFALFKKITKKNVGHFIILIVNFVHTAGPR